MWGPLDMRVAPLILSLCVCLYHPSAAYPNHTTHGPLILSTQIPSIGSLPRPGNQGHSGTITPLYPFFQLKHPSLVIFISMLNAWSSRRDPLEVCVHPFKLLDYAHIQ